MANTNRIASRRRGEAPFRAQGWERGWNIARRGDVPLALCTYFLNHPICREGVRRAVTRPISLPQVLVSQFLAHGRQYQIFVVAWTLGDFWCLGLENEQRKGTHLPGTDSGSSRLTWDAIGGRFIIRPHPPS